jgi:hypothetical protein
MKQGLEYKRPRRLKCDRRGSRQPHKQKKKKNIKLPCTPRSFKQCPSVRFPTKILHKFSSHVCHIPHPSHRPCCASKYEARHYAAFFILVLFPSSSVQIQCDQKVSVHLMITIQKVTSNVQSVPLPISWHLLTIRTVFSKTAFSINTGLALTPSVIPNSNYVTMVSDWNCLKYFYVFFVL